jgi:hypothetical protein
VFISGHAHLFQHYKKQGRDFFVIGGGGGLHHPLSRKRGPETALEADYSPTFHYLTVERCPTELKVVSRRLRDDRTGFEEGRVYHLDLP